MRRLAAIAVVAGALAAAQPAGAQGGVCMSPQPLDRSPVPAQLLSTFSVLDRASTPSDAWPKNDLLPRDESFYEKGIRRVRSAGGYRFFILPAHKSTPCGSAPELFIGALGSVSTVQGGASLNQVRHFGEWVAQGTSSGSVVAGLLPDGVAKVTVTYPKGRGHPGGVAYPRTVRKTVKVRNNVALFKLSRTPDDAASPSRQVWFSKSGRVIRRAPGNP
jgi:hypothetical protein